MTAHRGIKLAVMWSDPAFVHWSDRCSPRSRDSRTARPRQTATDMNSSTVDREHQSFEAVPASARSARRFVSETLCLYGASAGIISDYALAVSELASNIIEHGNGSSLSIDVDATDPDWWDVEVVGGSVTHPTRSPSPICGDLPPPTNLPAVAWQSCVT